MMKNDNELVAGIGGVFIHSSKPKELAEWYKEHLGINYEYSEEYDTYYFSFYYKELNDSSKQRYTVWSILKAKEKMSTENKTFTVNYRVHNMDKMLEHLRSLNVKIKNTGDFPEGKFAWIDDLDGNTIELWEDDTV